MKANGPGNEAGLQFYQFRNSFTCNLRKTISLAAKGFGEANTEIS